MASGVVLHQGQRGSRDGHGAQVAGSKGGEGWRGPLAGEDERRYKIQIVSQSLEGAQGTSAITRLRLGHTTLSAHLHRLRLSRDPFCPWCRTTPEAMEHFLLQCPRFHSTYCTMLPALCPGHHNTRPAHLPGGLRRPPLLAACCPSAYLCLHEQGRLATTPVVTKQDYPRAHKDPKEATKIYGSL
ncbi:hypothetical protein E2C01_045449 [Portunus trituberculatus]|uniref:Reverse transcriptase zinc-binding domain-containing protein n=1 Tax=Portunus trituberculatus TaxID=210409 RepID=A0A5B7FV13_PORTR|nr:hypothetical protein [Portunus trituberculatus]